MTKAATHLYAAADTEPHGLLSWSAFYHTARANYGYSCQRELGVSEHLRGSNHPTDQIRSLFLRHLQTARCLLNAVQLFLSLDKGSRLRVCKPPLLRRQPRSPS